MYDLRDTGDDFVLVLPRCMPCGDRIPLVYVAAAPRGPRQAPRYTIPIPHLACLELPLFTSSRSHLLPTQCTHHAISLTTVYFTRCKLRSSLMYVLFPSLATPCAYRDLICFSAVAFHFYSFLLAYTLIPPFIYHSSLRSFHLISISCTDPLRIYNLFPTGIYLGRVPTFSP